MRWGEFENVICKMCLQITYLIYMYKKDLVLNELQWLICHKAKPNQIPDINITRLSQSLKCISTSAGWCLCFISKLVNLFVKSWGIFESNTLFYIFFLFGGGVVFFFFFAFFFWFVCSNSFYEGESFISVKFLVVWVGMF